MHGVRRPVLLVESILNTVATFILWLPTLEMSGCVPTFKGRFHETTNHADETKKRPISLSFDCTVVND